jgi:SLOG cluster2
MGGKTGMLDLAGDRYAGDMPGVVEETLLTLRDGHLPIVLGAFGGAGRDIAIKLELLSPQTACVPRGAQAESYAPALQQIAELRERLPAELLPTLRSLAEMDQSELIGYRIAALCAAMAPGCHQPRDFHPNPPI